MSLEDANAISEEEKVLTPNQESALTLEAWGEKLEKILAPFYRDQSYELQIPENIHDDVATLFLDGIQAGLKSDDLVRKIKFVNPPELFQEPYNERVQFLRMKTGHDAPTLLERVQDEISKNVPVEVGGFDKHVATREILSAQRYQLMNGILFRLAKMIGEK